MEDKNQSINLNLTVYFYKKIIFIKKICLIYLRKAAEGLKGNSPTSENANAEGKK